MMSDRSEQAMERRGFFSWISGLGLAVLGGAASLVAGGFLYPIPRKKPPLQFLCLESELPEGKPVEIRDPRGRKVLLLKNASGELMALSTVCSHLGCTVFYRPEKNLFECPCHEGVFDGEGNPVSGPPQRPLTRYPVELREGKVFIRFS